MKQQNAPNSLRIDRIRNILEKELLPEILEIVDISEEHRKEKHQKSGKTTPFIPRAKSSQTHFKMKLVSSKFQNLSLLECHRLVNSLLKQEYKTGLHSIGMRLSRHG